MARVDGAELKQVARKVVQNASRPGGAMDKGEFTLGIARKEISIRMGLGPKGLEEAEWKARVKELVHLAMVSVGMPRRSQPSLMLSSLDCRGWLGTGMGWSIIELMAGRGG